MAVESELVSFLPAPGDSLISAAARALNYCREYKGAYRDSFSKPGVKREAGLFFRGAARCLAACERELIEPQLAAELRRLCRQHSSVPAVVLARSLAEAMDNTLGTRFAAGWPLESVTLEQGDAFPARSQPAWRAGYSTLTTDPLKLGSDRIDALRNLRLVPDLHGLRLVLDPRGAEQLSKLFVRESPPIFGVAILNESVEKEFAWEEFSEDGEDLFFRVVPKKGGEQLSRALAVLGKAESCAVDVLVLPELCFDEARMEAFVDHVREKAPGIALVVAGSHHVVRAGLRRNECLGVLSGFPDPLVHHKFTRFDLPRGEAVRLEGIRTDPSVLTVMSAGQGTCILLICKDFVEPGVIPILTELGVDLVLVPSLTPKWQIFEGAAHAFEAGSQAVVVVCNNAVRAHKPQPAAGLLASPSRNQAVLSTHLPAEVPVPALWVCNGPSHGWHPTT